MLLKLNSVCLRLHAYSYLCKSKSWLQFNTNADISLSFKYQNVNDAVVLTEKQQNICNVCVHTYIATYLAGIPFQIVFYAIKRKTRSRVSHLTFF